MSINSLFSHRSIRKYEARPIAQEVIDKIVEAAIRGSNTGNMQLYSIILTQDPAIKAKLAPAHFNQPMVMSAPLVATVCADINRMNKWCAARHADAGFDNMETLLTATIDATIAAQCMALAAEEAGLGVCFLGTTTYNPDVIIEALRLPRGVMPVTTVTIGYPAEEPGLTERLPAEAVAHRETYHDFSEADIERLYAEKEALPANRKFVEENAKDNLAQVFAEVRYPRANSEAFSQKLMDVTRKQGFLK